MPTRWGETSSLRAPREEEDASRSVVVVGRRSGTGSQTSVEAGLAPGTVGRRQVAASRGARDVAGHRRGGPTVVEALVEASTAAWMVNHLALDQDHVRTRGTDDERGRGDRKGVAAAVRVDLWASRGSATR